MTTRSKDGPDDLLSTTRAESNGVKCSQYCLDEACPLHDSAIGEKGMRLMLEKDRAQSKGTAA